MSFNSLRILFFFKKLIFLIKFSFLFFLFKKKKLLFLNLSTEAIITAFEAPPAPITRISLFERIFFNVSKAPK